MNFGANPRLGFRWCGVPIALASMAAVLLVAVLSFGCYGAAMLLGRVRPLRDAYEFLSRAYDRILDRLGQEVLQDPRDTPALRLMVSLSLTAVPIFADPTRFRETSTAARDRFLSFSLRSQVPAVCEDVQRQTPGGAPAPGFFSGKYEKVFGRYVEFFLGYLYGNAPELGRTAHVRLHHRENSGPDDTRRQQGLRSNESTRFPLVSLGQHLDGPGDCPLRLLQSERR